MAKIKIPQIPFFINPVLQALKKLGGSGSNQEINEMVAKITNLSEEQLNKLHKPGVENLTAVDYKIAWARTELKNYGIIDNTERGSWILTEKGKATDSVDEKEVRRFSMEKTKTFDENDRDSMFSWVQTHKELVDYLKTKQDNQTDLIMLLKKVKITGFRDSIQDSNGKSLELNEIDPFTFFCYIYKFGPDKRLKILQSIADQLGLSVPKGESGIPSTNAQKVCLFPFKADRINNEMQRLWKFYFSALDDNISDEQFADILSILGVGKTKLTEVLFYIMPEKYFPINGPSKPYLKEHLNIDPTFNSYSEYVEILNKIKEKTKIPFYELSYEAWKWNDQKKERNYWIFQGNPKQYNVVEAISNNELSTWSVSAHKDKIRIGDKVILWVTGKDRGCYALCEVESEIYEDYDDEIDAKYTLDPDMNKLHTVVKINITHDLIKNPITKDQIDSIKKLSKLKVGNQGTNFEATEEEYKTILKMVNGMKERKYWLYAPGDNAHMWEEFYKDGVMGLGWYELGDIKKYKTIKDIEKKLTEIKSSTQSQHIDALANYDFLNSISIGDYIIAKKGVTQILGYGIVKSDYYYDTSYEKYPHLRKVEWIKSGIWEPICGLAQKTLTDYTSNTMDAKYNLIKYKLKRDYLIDIMNYSIPYTPPSLNTILYGPPGTGKTYHTVLKAAEIVSKRKIEDTEGGYAEAKMIFNENKGDQIEFVTFHQNYSYEDFIQGLRPDTDNGKTLTFEKKDGVFMRIAINALFEYYKVLKNQPAQIDQEALDLNEAYLDFVEDLKKRPTLEFSSSSGLPITISSFSKKNSIVYNHQSSSRSYIVSGDRLIKLYKAFPKLNLIKNINNDIREAIGGCNSTIYWVALKEFIYYISNYKNSSDQDSKKEYEEVSFESKKKLLSTIGLEDLEKVKDAQVPNYVIIIDEINRANISRVFGELITLIEPDKRSHGAIPLTCTLPSGDEFIVPSNLYIIGTMNTADKSIALLDIALRRRFDFEAMYPKYEGEIVGKTVYDSDVLLKLNESIIKEKGHDFQIGHSYFMDKENNLVQRMNKKVIPLLMEYFMNNEADVKKILKSADLEVEEKSWPIRITGKA
ncbi:MAG: EVE domain-containing protein [Candidatus Kapabacteria bacterium]|jgi:5-methylcytosine-specific restriction protein B|nr:EVE domain-containing protein [Candidatus Kapabacteria bacterium]